MWTDIVISMWTMPKAKLSSEEQYLSSTSSLWLWLCGYCNVMNR